MSSDPVAPEDIHGDRRWWSQHYRTVEDCRLKKPVVLFVGDSIIQRMQDTETWRNEIVPLHAVNAGIGGDQTQHVLYRLSNGLLENCSPKVVVVMVGTNNYGHSTEQVVEGLEAICWSINNSLPETKIILLGLLPRGEKQNKFRDKVYEINYSLEKIVSALPNCYFLNCDPGFVRFNNTISSEDMLDYLHPTKRGYKKICPSIIGQVKKLLH